MGYWDYETDTVRGGYVYDPDSRPTLLAAGLKTTQVLEDTVTITMWPLVVNTEFVSASGTVQGRRDAAAWLPPSGGWQARWTIWATNTVGDGFARLVEAQKVANPSAADALGLKGTPAIILDGQPGGATLNGNVISGQLGAWTAGQSGSVNFNAAYVPFNLTTDEGWKAHDLSSLFDLSGGAGPEWIIRNGINDLTQDGNGQFLGDNLNGAVRFVRAKAVTDTDLGLPGRLLAPETGKEPVSYFTWEGYKAEVTWYEVINGVTETTPLLRLLRGQYVL